MKQDNNQKPLWKELNASRSQGVFDFDINANNGYDLYIQNSLKTIGTFIRKDVSYMPNEKEAEANAQYATLAVNNLTTLAEALETLIDRLHTNWDAITSGGQKGILTAITKEAKEALSKIS